MPAQTRRQPRKCRVCYQIRILILFMALMVAGLVIMQSGASLSF